MEASRWLQRDALDGFIVVLRERRRACAPRLKLRRPISFWHLRADS
jgi:hypothetical protein